jgi:ankyrin repeat protein
LIAGVALALIWGIYLWNIILKDAFITALKQGDTKQLQKLIDRGFDINTKFPYGLSMLHSAAYYGSPEIVELLLKNGADVNAQNEDGLTVLCCSANAEVMAVLLRHGADVNVQNNKGRTALDYAILGGGGAEVIEMLIGYGAVPGTKSVYY